MDDCFILTTGEDEARFILQKFNELNPNISFEMELPERGELSLLDFAVSYVPKSLDHPGPRFSFSFYKKSAKKEIFVNAKSALPTSKKISYIQNEAQRIRTRCSVHADETRSINLFGDVLRKNGYSEEVIGHMDTRGKRKRRGNNIIQKDPVYLRFPFINDSISNRVQHLFARADIPVKIYDRNYTLRSKLTRRRKEGTCSMKNCTISDTGLCNFKKCVYQIKCLKCNEIYIGSTLRQLHVRIHEHLTRDASSVFQHRAKCGGSLMTSRLATAYDVTSLRFKEAILTRKYAPKLNTKQESEEVLSLLFE